MIEVRVLDYQAIPALEWRLGEILSACVEGGASVSFLQPFSPETGEAFYRRLRDDFQTRKRLLIAAYIDGQLQGSVQLVLSLPPNQPHRAEVAKLLVHPDARGQGLAQQMMLALEDAARQNGKTLLVLDTVPGQPADRLYRRLGYTALGEIPNFALMPDGAPCSTVIFYKQI
jgi:ribosomal protein S18 acetylase RimI-like enzyme